MELRDLHYFRAAAEDQQTARAAERLGIAPADLSAQIRALEGELGVSLFRRVGRRHELTSAGRVFLDETVGILARLQLATIKAQQTARGSVGRLHIGFTETASFHPLMAGLISRFKERWPNVSLHLSEGRTTDLLAALQERRMDLAFVRPPLPASAELSLHPLAEEEVVVAVPADHPLAANPSVTLADLADEEFIVSPRAGAFGLSESVLAACEQAGFLPRIGQETPQLSSAVNLVAASLGIALVPECMRSLQAGRVRYLKLRDPIRVGLVLAHATSASAQTVLNFIPRAGEVESELS